MDRHDDIKKSLIKLSDDARKNQKLMQLEQRRKAYLYQHTGAQEIK